MMEAVMPMLVCLIATLFTVAAIAAPHWTSMGCEEPDPARQDLHENKDKIGRLSLIINDLELDLQTGKLSQEDYEEMRARSQSELDQLKSKLQA